jgi:hydroxymethylpyrimidine pyrophosphatase-like HAD family hydrolase
MSRVAAIGDGENDHSLLLAAAESAAVANAVTSLKGVARRVTAGERGMGVAEFVDALAAGTVEPPARV